MFQSKSPVFKMGRILKIEMLEALRDTPLAFMKTTYADYPDGIIRGFDVTVQEDELVVQPGLLKCQTDILVLDDMARIPYEATDQVMRLLICIQPFVEGDDIKERKAHFQLSAAEAGSMEWEMLRFKLKAGAYLRADYQSFDDLITEYNTVNPVFCKHAVPNQYSSSREMVRLFCHYVQELGSQQQLDQLFCLQAMQANYVVGNDVLMYYLSQRLGGTRNDFEPLEIHRQLAAVLIDIRQQVRRTNAKMTPARKMIVD